MTPRNMAYIVCVMGMLRLSSVMHDASKAVSERLLKLRGRWKTDEAKDMYVLEPGCNRLSVTKYLGI